MMRRVRNASMSVGKSGDQLYAEDAINNLARMDSSSILGIQVH